MQVLVLFHMLIILQWGGLSAIFTPKMTLFKISVAFEKVSVKTFQVMAFFQQQCSLVHKRGFNTGRHVSNSIQVTVKQQKLVAKIIPRIAFQWGSLFTSNIITTTSEFLQREREKKRCHSFLSQLHQRGVNQHQHGQCEFPLRESRN